MSLTPTESPGEMAEVLDRVRMWTPRQRLALARRILESLETPPPRRMPLDDVFGLLRTDRPAPTDEECRRIVEEERLRKYG